MPAKEFVARRALQTGSGVARLFRKRICTFEKRGEGATREPARWFDKENGGGGGCDGERRINAACHRTDREIQAVPLPYASPPTEHFPNGWGFLLPTSSLSPRIENL